ncbi:galactose-1-phosphate uridylyltransferase [Candidatus Woesearchaeota archaeon]|nr:galactose-1-phosphate uridylyltransferase [Candidatus Woesearchaeota archaeon]
MELRKDYILNRWVIVSEAREKRPHEFKKEIPVTDIKTCFFCPGNEAQTPPEIGRIGNPWKVRWFPNKFAAVAEGKSGIQTHNKFYTFGNAVGNHEVIVETNDHTKQLHDLSKEEIGLVLQAYKDRITHLQEREYVKYVCVFKNSGISAGTSIVHSHSQLITSQTIPEEVMQKVAARNKYVQCPYCEIIQNEKKSDRRCFETDEWVAFCPYASRFMYEIWIFPKKHILTIEQAYLNGLADILQMTLKKIGQLGCSYNYYLHYSPKGEDLHFHIEVCPRISTWAGFELSSGTIITGITPEQAAQYYRA